MPLTEAQKAALRARQTQRNNATVNAAVAEAVTPEKSHVGDMREELDQQQPELLEDVSRETYTTTADSYDQVSQEQTPFDVLGRVFEAASERMSQAMNGKAALEEYTPVGIVRGLDIESVELDLEQKETLAEMVFSYVGQTPRDLVKYTGRWIKCLGCVIAPVEAEVPEIDRESGEVLMRPLQWDIPMFKLDVIDDETGMNVVIAGGGVKGKQFARTMNALYGPGDWDKPKEIFITQEERRGINRQTGDSEPHRLYRFMLRKEARAEKKNG